MPVMQQVCMSGVRKTLPVLQEALTSSLEGPRYPVEKLWGCPCIYVVPALGRGGCLRKLIRAVIYKAECQVTALYL